MTKTARIATAAWAVLAVAGIASGLLIEHRSGAAGALEWALRTLVVIAAPVALIATLALLLRLRRRGPQPAGWAAAIAASLAFLVLVAIPVGYAVYLTHLPARRAVHDADLGAPKRSVTLTTRSGVELRGWYVPSRNGAAVARDPRHRLQPARRRRTTPACSPATATASCSSTCTATARAAAARSASAGTRARTSPPRPATSPPAPRSTTTASA